LKILETPWNTHAKGSHQFLLPLLNH
jgi:hypothetical protein